MADVHIWRVQGAGGVRAYRNGAMVEDMTPEQPNKTVQFGIGDTFTFEAYPVPGWQFDKYCSDPQCITNTTQNPFTGKITQETGNLYVYFSPKGAKISVTVPGGGGAVKVYRNGTLLGETRTSQVFEFVLGDTVKFEAVPAENYEFEKYCTDVACSGRSSKNPFIAVVTQESGAMLVYFSEKGTSPLWIAAGIGAAVLGAAAIYRATRGGRR